MKQNWLNVNMPITPINILSSGSTFPLDLPMINRIAAQTIGLDLVVVKPLSLPPINLIYVDFIYGPTLLELRRKKIDKIIQRIKINDILIKIEQYNE